MASAARDLLVVIVVWRLLRWLLATPVGWLCLGLAFLGGEADLILPRRHTSSEPRPYVLAHRDAWKALRLDHGTYDPRAETYAFDLVNPTPVTMGEVKLHCDEPRWIGDEVIQTGEDLDDVTRAALIAPLSTKQDSTQLDSNDQYAAGVPTCRIIAATAFEAKAP